MTIETDTLEAPSYWAPYLINGDATGMSDDELAECDRWLDGFANNWAIVSCGEEEYFGRFYFAVAGRTLGTNLTEYIIHKF